MTGRIRRWIRERSQLSSLASVRRGGVAFADQLVASATNFLTGIIVGRVCAQEQFGLYMLGFSIMQVAIRLQASLISSPYMVFSPRLSGSEKVEYLGSTAVHQLGLSTLFLSLLVIGGVALSTGVGPEGLAPVMWALAVTMTFILLREYARNVCFSELRFTAALVLDSAVAVLQVGGLVLLAFLGLLDAGLVYWVIGLACGLAGTVWLYRMRSSITPKVNRVVPDLVRNWSVGKWIVASSLLYDVSIYAYPWVLTFFHGVDSAGVWAACFGAVAITNPLVIGMVNHAGPEIVHSFAAGGVPALRRVVQKINRVFLLLLAPLTLVLFVIGDWLVVQFYGQDYGGHGLVVSVLALDMWMSPPRIALSRALFAMERADLDCATNTVSLIVLLTFGIWMVKQQGPVGVAVAVLLGNLTAALAKLAAYSLLTRQGRLKVDR